MKLSGKLASFRGAIQLSLLLALCVSTSKVQAALSGTYTIDGSGTASSTNYKTFASAVSDMVSGTRADGGTANGSGVSGAVTFTITGVSSTNTVTFQSSSGDSSKVILQFASTSTSNFVLLLNGADYVTFKKLTIKTTSTTTTNARVVELRGGAHFNTFTGCHFQGLKSTSSTANGGAIVYSSATDKDSSNVYSGNYFKYGTNAIALVGSSTIKERGVQIKNNIIDSAYGTMLNLDNQIAPLIQGNRLSGAGSAVSHGILLSSVTENPMVLQNRVSYAGTAGMLFTSMEE
jgi:hypothetical protein